MTLLDAIAHDFEEVSIETVHVGDYVCVGSDRAPRCVLAKASTRLADKVAGWRVELMGSVPMWLPARAMVMRKRFGSVRRSASPRHTTRPRSARMA